MASISITVDLDRLPTLEISDDVVTNWIEARLNDARNTFIQNVSRGGGGGRTYRRGRRGMHRASAPGEYPVTDSGRLVNSVNFVVHSAQEGVLYADVEYAKFLTEGTARMAARRMLADALTEVLESRPREDALARAARLR